MKLQRIARMRPSELADRLRQERLKLFERLHLVDNGELGPSALRQNVARRPGARLPVDRDAIARTLLERFQEHAHERFFAGPLHRGTAGWIAERMPEARDAVLSAAANSLAGRFDLLGYEQLGFGSPVDWHLEPLAGKRAPLKHWTRIDPLDRESVGDHKLVWELNRHQWLLHWAQAYAFTDDERYAERCVETLERWLCANPTGLGINWTSSLELALRLVSWCWLLVWLRRSAALRPEFFARMLGAVHAHATHIARHLSTTFSPNTHLLGEALALFYAGNLFPDCEGAAAWAAAGRGILIEQLGRQIHRDGVCFEQSTCYQRYTVEMYLHFMILAERNGVELPAQVAKRVQRAADFLLALLRSDGSVAQIGDGDGGWLLPLLPRAADDMRGVLGLAAAFFGRDDYAAAAGPESLEAAWLLGPGAFPAAAAQRAATERRQSRLFASGGYAVLCDSETGAHRLIFDVGPLGCPISAAHGHADLLGLCCDVFGEPCIVDPGMPTYSGDPGLRDAFRSTALHSSVMLDGRSQATPDGPFSWRERPRARLRSFVSNGAFDCVDAEHGAYRAAGGALTHRRRVIFVKPRYWLVIDELREDAQSGEHCIELGFQLAPHQRVNLEPPWVRTTTPRGRALLLRVTSDVPVELSIHEGEREPHPIRGWFSRAYGQLEPAPALVFRAHARLPLRLVSVLLPVARADAAAPEVFPPESDLALLRRLSA